MPRRKLVAAPLLVLLLTGCIEFVDQTMSWRHDAKSDTLHIFQHYRGIFGADKPGSLSENEVEQFTSVLKTQRTFFFNNWITEIDREQFLKTIADLRDPAKIAKDKTPPEAARDYIALLQLLVDNTRIENGPLYLDAQKRLCGVQKVTITRISRIVAALNTAIPHFLCEEAEKDGTGADQRALYLAAARRGGEFIRLEGSRIRVNWPGTRADFDSRFGANGEALAQLSGFKQSGGGATFTNDTIAVSIGRPGAPTGSLTLPMSTNVYTPNAIEFARRNAGIRDAFDVEGAAKAFLAPSR